MSRIRRLSIRGIRNFGDDNEESTIRFTRPLTLILGPNGTGKTTIIEALKFATTGEFPPGSDRGKSFIYDPNLSKSSTVRGSVKAELWDAQENIYVIARTIESIKAGTFMKFKTLDSTLSRRKKGTATVKSLSHRCADVDNEISYIMGVSKPILNYVIFCHQEDLNWPFQEGKKLKEKFDEIFDSAKFNKALESITKQCKQMQQELKILQAEQQATLITLNMTKEKESKREQQKNRLESAQKKMKQLEDELKPIYDKLDKIEKLASDYKNLLAEQEKKKMELEICMQQIVSLKENIHEFFEGSTEELQTEIDSYDDILLRNSAEISKMEEGIVEIAEQESKLGIELSREMITLGTLRQQLADKDMKIENRNILLNKILQFFNFEEIDLNVGDPEVVAVNTKRLKDKMQELEQRAQRNRSTRAERVEKYEERVTSMRTELSMRESELKMKTEELEKIQHTEMSAIRAQLNQLSSAPDKLEQLGEQLKRSKVKLDELNASFNQENAKRNIQEMLSQRNELEKKLNSVDAELEELHKEGALHSELEMHRAALRLKEQEASKLKTLLKENVEELLGITEMSNKKIKSDLDCIQEKLVEDIRGINQEIQVRERELAGLETTISHAEKELTSKQKEIESDKQKVSLICHYKDFDEMLQLQSHKVKDLQNKRGIYAHQAAAYKEYMRQLKDPDPCCPICHRGFQESTAVEKLLQEMQVEVQTHPGKLAMCEKELKTQQEKYDAMLQLRPIVDKILQMEETELEKLRLNLSKTKRSVAQIRVAIAELEAKKSGPEEKLTRCKTLMSDAVVWDKCVDEIIKCKGTIEGFQIRLTGIGMKVHRSVYEVQSERDSLKNTLKSLRNETEKLQAQQTAQAEELRSVQQAHNSIHEQEITMREDLTKLHILQDKEKMLKSRSQALQSSIEELEERCTVLTMDTHEKSEELRHLKIENSTKTEKEMQVLSEGGRWLTELQSLQAEVDILIQRDIPEALSTSEKRTEKLQCRLQQFSEQKSDAEKSIMNLKQKVNNQEMRKRQLCDNLIFRKSEKSLETLREQYNVMEEKLGKTHYTVLMDEKTELKSTEEALIKKKNMIKGSQEELERSINQYDQELNTDEHRMSRKKYKEKMIEITVHQQAMQNLQAYSKILDLAMIEFHEERMSTVNKIMKDMWKMVYTGADTSSIEIKTEATEGIGSTRRSYNYRLVQTKHGHEMDMKGRCSTGQKVLASIIIRLALAETFSKDCGVLALDEPTTNLDEENANSLATALAEVVKMRSRHQKNFQLIVISHDEKFLLKLANLNNTSGFYELYRRNDGLTSIKYCQVNGIKDEISDDEIYIDSNENNDSRTDGGSRQGDRNQNKKRRNWDGDEDQNPRKKKFVLNI